MTFLFARMVAVVVLIATIVLLTRAPWPDGAGIRHSAMTGLFVHGCYLGGVFVALDQQAAGGTGRAGGEPAAGAHIDVGQSAPGREGDPAAVARASGLALLASISWCTATRKARRRRPPGRPPRVALIGMTVGTFYQKRFGGNIDWRTGFLIQYAAAAALFGIAALLFETRVVHWTSRARVRARVARARAVVRSDLAVVFPHPARGGDACGEPVVSYAADHRADGLDRLRRAAHICIAHRHGDLRGRRCAGELAGRQG